MLSFSVCMAVCRCGRNPLSSLIRIACPSYRFNSTSYLQWNRKFSTSASLQMEESTSSPNLVHNNNSRWKPMCLYFTQGKCTKMDDPVHTERFDHDCSVEFEFNASGFKKVGIQELDFFLVLDLEGKVEILEFPVLLYDVKRMAIVDFFHRFVRPTQMPQQRINDYVEGKYGKFGVDRVWHDTAIPFEEVIQHFEAWLDKHHLMRKELDGYLNRAAFVTCGNWDLKRKVPEQCRVSRIKLPQYFMEWINLKDIYLNFYKRRAPGMLSMMRQLKIPLVGSHHLGIDDAKNITRVLQHMLMDGALLQITARRNSQSPENVEFLFEKRIK